MKMRRNPNIEIDFDDNIGVIWLPWWLSGKESACNTGDLGSIPELGRSSGEGNGYPLQYPYLGNTMNRGAWRATVNGVAKSGI